MGSDPAEPQSLQFSGRGTMCKIFEQGKVTYLGPSDVPHGGEFLELALLHGRFMSWQVQAPPSGWRDLAG